MGRFLLIVLVLLEIHVARADDFELKDLCDGANATEPPAPAVGPSPARNPPPILPPVPRPCQDCGCNVDERAKTPCREPSTTCEAGQKIIVKQCTFDPASRSCGLDDRERWISSACQLGQTGDCVPSAAKDIVSDVSCKKACWIWTGHGQRDWICSPAQQSFSAYTGSCLTKRDPGHNGFSVFNGCFNNNAPGEEPQCSGECRVIPVNVNPKTKKCEAQRGGYDSYECEPLTGTLRPAGTARVEAGAAFDAVAAELFPLPTPPPAPKLRSPSESAHEVYCDVDTTEKPLVTASPNAQGPQ